MAIRQPSHLEAWVTKSYLNISIFLTLTLATILAPFATAQSTFKVLHPFTWAHYPEGALARDAAGNLYGTTMQDARNDCGGFGCGAVWKLTLNSDGTWGSTILHAFTGADGWKPFGVTLDADGNLYGTTVYGGNMSACQSFSPGGCGLVYMLKHNPNGRWTYNILHEFNSSDGALPFGALIFDAVGNLYGTTSGGGNFKACQSYLLKGCGLVFMLTHNPSGSWAYNVLHEFNSSDGAAPTGPLTFDASGNLYGTAGGTVSSSRCAMGCGVVFKLTPNSRGTWAERVLYKFTGTGDGAEPGDGLIFAASGKLYGTTYLGGAHDGGTVFELAPNPDGTWTEGVLHSFTYQSTAADGSLPGATVTFDASGNLYGTTSYGGAGLGTVFKLTPASGGWSESIVHAFWGYGARPQAPILVDPAGHLYGTASQGTGYGLVFEITP